ncbi:MAG: acetylxylan esterase, partial [Nanoarchaeota archaeon]
MKRSTKIILAILIATALFLFIQNRQKGVSDWYVTSEGILKYPEDRGSVDFTRALLEDNDTYTIDKIVYDSRGKQIYALLYMPKGKENIPCVIDLPAAAAAKESYSAIAKGMASHGYAYLVIDQRGVGETGGVAPPIAQDYNDFMAGKEPFLHLMVYDALKAFDVLKEINGVDRKNIVMAGESMGGRAAIIAGSMDSRIKAVIGYSTAGYEAKLGHGATFISSFNPNTYVQNISPRKFIMFHSKDDSVVPYNDAMLTFDIAKEPKKFVDLPETCDHGYCLSNMDMFFNELKELTD